MAVRGLASSLAKPLKRGEASRTVNDVVLTVSGGALRRYLDARGELPESSLLATVPVFHGAGLNITVMSNNGQVHVGIIGCRELMPKVWELVDHST